MNALKRITYNCRKATFLIEKKNADSITFKEELELKFHLAGCSVCRIFQQQSMLIDKLVKTQFLNHRNSYTLDSTFKESLAKKIAEKVDNKIDN